MNGLTRCGGQRGGSGSRRLLRVSTWGRRGCWSSGLGSGCGVLAPIAWVTEPAAHLVLGLRVSVCFRYVSQSSSSKNLLGWLSCRLIWLWPWDQHVCRSQRSGFESGCRVSALVARVAKPAARMVHDLGAGVCHWCIGFRTIFPINWPFLTLLNGKTKLLPFARKKKNSCTPFKQTAEGFKTRVTKGKDNNYAS